MIAPTALLCAMLAADPPGKVGRIASESAGTQSEVNAAQRLHGGATMPVEVTRDKKFAWTFVERPAPGIHEVETPATDGMRATESP